MKSEKDFGKNFFWVLGGIPEPESKLPFVYYIIPASIMAREINKAHRTWLTTPGMRGQEHNDNKIRTVTLPPYRAITGWDISEYQNRWDLIEQKLKTSDGRVEG
jgi:hypothetical protein